MLVQSSRDQPCLCLASSALDLRPVRCCDARSVRWPCERFKTEGVFPGKERRCAKRWISRKRKSEVQARTCPGRILWVVALSFLDVSAAAVAVGLLTAASCLQPPAFYLDSYCLLLLPGFSLTKTGCLCLVRKFTMLEKLLPQSCTYLKTCLVNSTAVSGLGYSFKA